MNKLIKQQLNAVSVAKLPPFDDSSTTIMIPKYNKEDVSELLLGKCYLIKVEDYIVHPFDGFTLHDNWNRGVAPKSIYMNCEVQQLMGKMVKIVAIGYDYDTKTTLNDSWEGWLPKSSIQIIKEL
jgi:hypothetical protein